MKKHLIIFATLVLFVCSSCAKKAGNPITKVFDIEGTYTELEVQDAFDVTVSNEVSQIEITVGENVMPYVVVERINNTLKIYIKGNIVFTGNNDMDVKLPYNADLTSVDMSGASSFLSEFPLDGQDVKVILSGDSDFKGDIKASNLNMNLSGSSDIEGNVEANVLNLVLTGASEAELTGLVGKLNLDLSGASDLEETVENNRYGLVCNECEGSMTGACEAYIHCDGAIKVSLSGASNLYFTGTGNPADSDVSGASHIVHQDNP